MPSVPGSRNVSIPSHLGHVANGESDGTVQDRLPRSAALDEGRISGTGSGHSKADGEIPQGGSTIGCALFRPLKGIMEYLDSWLKGDG